MQEDFAVSSRKPKLAFYSNEQHIPDFSMATGLTIFIIVSALGWSSISPTKADERDRGAERRHGGAGSDHVVWRFRASGGAGLCHRDVPRLWRSIVYRKTMLVTIIRWWVLAVSGLDDRAGVDHAEHPDDTDGDC